MIKHSYQISSKLADWFKGWNTGQADRHTHTHTHTHRACGSLTGGRLRKIISPDSLCVAGCWLLTAPLTQDPVDPHLRKRRPRRLLPPNDRDSGIQEYVNGSSGTNIVWPWVGSRCGRFCFDCKLGWLSSVQSVNCLWSHNLLSHRTQFNNTFPICPHCPAGPSTRTSEHNHGDTKHQQPWNDPRSLTVRPQ